MEVIANIVLPVFGLIGLGYGVAWLRLLPENTDTGLSEFSFTIGIPLLLFRTVVGADFSHGSPWLLWAAYFPILAVIWIAGTLVMRRVFGRDARAGLVGGVSASYSNALLIGLPLVLIAYGDDGASAMALLLAVHLAAMMMVSAVLIERASVADQLKEREAGVSVVLRSIGRNLVSNPIFIAIIAGNLWNATGLVLPDLASTLIDRLADVAATIALFAMGMSLQRFGVRGNVVPALVLGVLKLAVMPALVFVSTRWIFPLPPAWAKAMVLAAACPTGVNAYLIAVRFKTGEGLASNAIIITTALAAATVSFWLHVLG
jgi:predicted permease